MKITTYDINTTGNSANITEILALFPSNIQVNVLTDKGTMWLETEDVDEQQYAALKLLLGGRVYEAPKEVINFNWGVCNSGVGLNIRNNPSIDSNIIAVLECGQRCKLDKTFINDKWYKISAPFVGYVYKEYINTSSTPTAVSSNLVNFTASWEGFSATPYLDAGGNWTVGFGDCTYNEKPQSVTYQQALTNLENTLNNLASQISTAFVEDNLTQYEFDALVDFAYNLGFSALMGSDLVANFRTCDNNSIIEPDFTAWSYCDGNELKGLYRRRIAEYQMFCLNQYNNN